MTNKTGKQPAYHARSTTNVHRASRAENHAHCVNCDTNCFKTSDANLLRDSFNLLAQRRIRSSGFTELLLAFNPAESRRHVPRRFQIGCVLFHYTVSNLHSTNRRLASRLHQLVSKFIRLVSKLGVTLLSFGYLTFLTCPLDLWRTAFTGSIDSGSFSTNSATAATAETVENCPKILVRLLLLLSVLQRVNPTRCSSSCILHNVFQHLLL